MSETRASAGSRVRGSARALYRIVRQAFKGMQRAGASQAAAGMAYYFTFSLFPLLLVLVVVGSFFLQSQRAFRLVAETLTGVLPTSQALVEENLQNVLNRRGTVGVVGLVGLVWSATGAFTALVRNINRAWPQGEKRGFVAQRLIALAMVAALGALLLFSLVASTVIGLLSGSEGLLEDWLALSKTRLWRWLSEGVPWFLALLLFLGLYRWVPSVDVPWQAALWSALVTATAWEAAKLAFVWYLNSGLVRYELVYGSLATVVALMFWIYVSSWIVLLGAHLGAAVAAFSGQDGAGPCVG